MRTVRNLSNVVTHRIMQLIGSRMHTLVPNCIVAYLVPLDCKHIHLHYSCKSVLLKVTVLGRLNCTFNSFEECVCSFDYWLLPIHLFSPLMFAGHSLNLLPQPPH